MERVEPLIEIIIPNWNGKELLAECLQSLNLQTSREFSVTVVDNGSTDGSLELLKTSYPEVNCIAFEENKGFSVAVNEGIRESRAAWVFLLNNDIEVAPDCIEELVEAVNRYGDYAFFALKMVNYNERHLLDGAGDEVLRGGVGYRIGTMEEDNGQYNSDRDVFGACAGAALYSKDFFAQVGLFDEDFFAYLEDVDLNMRAVRSGLKCKYLASAIVYHIGSATSGSKINPTTIRLSTKNNINVLVKNYPVSQGIRFFPAILVYQCMWFLFVCKKMKLLSYLRGLAAGMAQLPLMWTKRKGLREGAKVSDKQFGSMLKKSERAAVQSIMDRRSSLGKGNGLLSLYVKIFL